MRRISNYGNPKWIRELAKRVPRRWLICPELTPAQREELVAEIRKVLAANDNTIPIVSFPPSHHGPKEGEMLPLIRELLLE